MMYKLFALFTLVAVANADQAADCKATCDLATAGLTADHVAACVSLCNADLAELDVFDTIHALELVREVRAAHADISSGSGSDSGSDSGSNDDVEEEDDETTDEPKGTDSSSTAAASGVAIMAAIAATLW
jgi:hypothetical protein